MSWEAQVALVSRIAAILSAEAVRSPDSWLADTRRLAAYSVELMRAVRRELLEEHSRSAGGEAVS